MGIGINIGNTLENTATWETGWGNPPITREYIESLKALGFNTVRVPVAWDTYAHDGRIDRDKLRRVGEVADWITSQGMFCVINIHWDGGWINSDDQKRFAKTYHTFSPEAERKFQSYWSQIANYFADRDQHLVFESLNEESNFEKVGSEAKAYAILAHVNQLFVDTVRRSGGNNAKRLLIVAGYGTDFEKTSSSKYVLPKDEVPHKILISVHYYTPWPFAGMTHDESWGKMRPTWGTSADIDELNRLFNSMEAFSREERHPRLRRRIRARLREGSIVTRPVDAGGRRCRHVAEHGARPVGDRAGYLAQAALPAQCPAEGHVAKAAAAERR